MRGAFFKTLAQIAAEDPRVLLLTGDLGYMAVEPFAERNPRQFLNVGVCEQNMVGLATGLAEAGFIPYLYSIVNFAVLRPYEFIRNGPILHRLPVRIVGVGGGVEYGNNGASHWGIEDLGVLRIQPGIDIIAPADWQQTATALKSAAHLPGPVYFRLGKDDTLVVPGLEGRFELGGVQLIGSGHDLLLLAVGNAVKEAVEAARILLVKGIGVTVAVVAHLHPPPIDPLLALLGRFGTALTVEAHYITGGLGSMASEIVAEHGLGCRIVRCGLRAIPSGRSGSQGYLHNCFGISAAALVDTACKELNGIHG